MGVLELPRDGSTNATENTYFSGVFIEASDLTTSVARLRAVSMVRTRRIANRH
jgi:hypothetical protein